MKIMEELELKSPSTLIFEDFVNEENGYVTEALMHKYGKQCFEAARFHYEDEDGWDGVYYNSFRDYEDYKLNLK